jgi:hypothetical protein
MEKKKSGNDIVDGLSRKITRAEKDCHKLDLHRDDQRAIRFALRDAFKILRAANGLLRGLIREIPAPERPVKQVPTPKLSDEPRLVK